MKIFLVIFLSVFAFGNQDQNTYTQDADTIEAEAEQNEESLNNETPEDLILSSEQIDDSIQTVHSIAEENSQGTNNDGSTNSIENELNPITQEINENEEDFNNENFNDLTEQLSEEIDNKENEQLKLDEILENTENTDKLASIQQDLPYDGQETTNCASDSCLNDSVQETNLEEEQQQLNTADIIQESIILDEEVKTIVEEELKIDENTAEAFIEENNDHSKINSEPIESSSNNPECNDDSCIQNSDIIEEAVNEASNNPIQIDQENAIDENKIQEEIKKEEQEFSVEVVADQSNENNKLNIEELEKNEESTNTETTQDRNEAGTSDNEINTEEETDQNNENNELNTQELEKSKESTNAETSQNGNEAGTSDNEINTEELQNTNIEVESKENNPEKQDELDSSDGDKIKESANIETTQNENEVEMSNKEINIEEPLSSDIEIESNENKSEEHDELNSSDEDKVKENANIEEDTNQDNSAENNYDELNISEQDKNNEKINIEQYIEEENLKETEISPEAAEKMDPKDQISDIQSEETQSLNQIDDLEADQQIIATDKQSEITADSAINSEDQKETPQNAENHHSEEILILDIDQVDFKVLLIKFALRTENLISSIYFFIRNKQPYNVILFYFSLIYIISKIFKRKAENHSFSYKIVEEKQQSTITQIVEAKNKELEKIILLLNELTKTELDKSQIDKLRNKLDSELKDKFSAIKKEISIIHEKQNEFQSQILSSHQEIWMKIDELKEGPEEIPYVPFSEVAVSLPIPDKPRNLDEDIEKKEENKVYTDFDQRKEIENIIEDIKKDRIENQISSIESQISEQKNHKISTNPPIQQYQEESIDYLKFPSEIKKAEEQKLIQEKEESLEYAQEEREIKTKNPETEEEPIENKNPQPQEAIGVEKSLPNPPKPKIPSFAPPGFKPAQKTAKITKVEPEKKPQKLPETRPKVISQPFIQKSPFAQL